MPRLGIIRYRSLIPFHTNTEPRSQSQKWSCLQEVLRDKSKPGQSGNLVIFPPGNTSVPKATSYSMLYTLANQNSIAIRSLDGFHEGHPVLIHLDDHWDVIFWFWSVLFAGGLPVLSSPLSAVDSFRHKHLQSLSALLESPICLTKETSLQSFDGPHTFRIHTIESILSNNNTATLNKGQIVSTAYGRHKKNSSAVLMLTSGSTGNAKAVSLTHRQILAAISGKAKIRPLPKDHVASLVEIHLQALWLGVDQVHAHAADIVSSPTTFLDLLDRYQICRSFAPNFFLAKLVQSAYENTWNLSNLTVLASGGEPNDVKICGELSALLARCGAPHNVITPGFGMTETCAGAIFNLNFPSYDLQNSYSIASLGTCMTGIEMRVTAPGKTPVLCLPNEPGNLEIRGEVVFNGYYRSPDATAQAFTSDGWFCTGDQAVLDAAGNLVLIGRAQDVMNINGVKFGSEEIQTHLREALSNHVARVISFPSSSSHTGQITVAYLPKTWPMTGEDMQKVDEIAIQACFQITASCPLVFSLREHSLPRLPISALGKISRSKMRSLFESGVFANDVEVHNQTVAEWRRNKGRPEPTTIATESELAILDDFAVTLGVAAETIDLDTPAFALGFTSMNLIQLKHRIDIRLNTTVPIITLMKHPTPRSLAAALIHELQTPGMEVLADYDPVVKFQLTGSKTPLWLVHPGVGEVLVFVGLAQSLLDDDRPVFALRARGFEKGQRRFASINETVETYVKAIRTHQPHGPYAIAGYSYGTMLAFEIAKRLDCIESAGAVRFLGSFNLPPHIKSRMRQLNRNLCLLHLTQFLGLLSEAVAEDMEEHGFGAITHSEAMMRIISLADPKRLSELNLSSEDLSSWVDVAYGLQSMASDYEPTGEVNNIDVFHAIPLKAAAASQEEWVGEHLAKWANFCRTTPKFHKVGGAHYTMINPDHVGSFAITLKKALQDRGV
ncbi:hypothetical protein F4680DRAFT_460178 [Xylaria scruposa]|nr:hypothetical protein F4680DRAFT_460178 [Xylaria scruposa]